MIIPNWSIILTNQIVIFKYETICEIFKTLIYAVNIRHGSRLGPLGRRKVNKHGCLEEAGDIGSSTIL